ncbi:hypothetical protein L596_006092 [Steinernema carpocapsae]|uniref:Uncharacterized protein n=1 Tax=Steinernema carpocapsae TaxID=34508 RepID=A0A4U8V2F1_STECR|nr:hypothetical protein L596_006092 [Steinernema carpocapsae]
MGPREAPKKTVEPFLHRSESRRKERAQLDDDKCRRGLLALSHSRFIGPQGYGTASREGVACAYSVQHEDTSRVSLRRNKQKIIYSLEHTVKVEVELEEEGKGVTVCAIPERMTFASSSTTLPSMQSICAVRFNSPLRVVRTASRGVCQSYLHPTDVTVFVVTHFLCPWAPNAVGTRQKTLKRKLEKSWKKARRHPVTVTRVDLGQPTQASTVKRNTVHSRSSLKANVPRLAFVVASITSRRKEKAAPPAIERPQPTAEAQRERK